MTGRVTPGAAPPSAPAPAPALSFPPGPSGKGSQGTPVVAAAGAVPLRAPSRLHPARRASIAVSNVPGPRLLPGASPAPGSPCLPRREYAFASAGRGGPGRAPWAPAWGWGWGWGLPGASQWPDLAEEIGFQGLGPESLWSTFAPAPTRAPTGLLPEGAKLATRICILQTRHTEVLTCQVTCRRSTLLNLG